MADLDLVVPSALVAPEIADAVARTRPLPHLARIARLAPAIVVETVPADGALAPWQSWLLATRAGVPPEDVNVAAVGIPSIAGAYLAEPVHFALGNTQVTLADPSALAVDVDEARALAATARPILADAGWTLAAIDDARPTRWRLRNGNGPLSAVAVERAIGDNVASWRPRGVVGESGRDAAALAWLRCANEIQMAWFDHPVNTAREAAGRPAINALWLSGDGRPAPAAPRYASIVSTLPLATSLSLAPEANRALETRDDLAPPAHREDWAAWGDGVARLDARIAALLADLVDGALATLTVVLSGRDLAKIVTLAKRDCSPLRRAWRAWHRGATVAELLAEPAA